MELRHVKHPFEAVIGARSRVLILGSVPSVKSAELNFYYMHPMNRFYKVLSSLLGEDLYDAPIEEKKRILLERGVALYDSVEECDISGSSDSSIKNIIPADIPALLDVADIRRIFCNGSASYRYLIKFHPHLADMTTLLPSTSPANAAFSLPDLISHWQVILPYLP